MRLSACGLEAARSFYKAPHHSKMGASSTNTSLSPASAAARVPICGMVLKIPPGIDEMIVLIVHGMAALANRVNHPRIA